MKANARIEFSPRFKANMGRVFQPGGTAQRYIDAVILESMDPYLPKDTGELMWSGKLNTVIGSGEIIWRTPYARHLYYGILMVDPKYGVGGFHDKESGRFWSRKGIKKVPSGRQIKFRGGGKRGALWCERWKRDNLTAFTKNLQVKAGEWLRH